MHAVAPKSVVGAWASDGGVGDSVGDSVGGDGVGDGVGDDVGGAAAEQMLLTQYFPATHTA